MDAETTLDQCFGGNIFSDKIPDGSNSTCILYMTYYVCTRIYHIYIHIYTQIFLIWLATYIQLSTFILIPCLSKLSMLMQIIQKNLFFCDFFLGRSSYFLVVGNR